MKLERNAPCPCGSGLKYKKCCLVKNDDQDFLWRRVGQASNSLDRKLIKYIQEKYHPEFFDFAYDYYFGDPDGEFIESVPVDLLPFIGPLSIFHWFLDEDEDCGGVQLPQGHPVSDSFFRKKKQQLSGLELDLFTQHQVNPFSFFLIESTDPGRGFKVKDLLVKRGFYISEVKGSQSVNPGDIVFGKVFEFAGGLNTMGVMAPWAIPNDFHVSILDFRDELRSELRLRRDLTSQDLSLVTETVLEYLADIVDALHVPFAERVRNSDGHSIKPTVLTFSITDPDRIFRLLAPLNLVESYRDMMKYAEKDRDGGLVSVSFPWLRVRDGEDPRKSNTVLAQLTITRDRLVADVNSTERSDALREKLAEILPDEEYKLLSVEMSDMEEQLPRSIEESDPEDPDIDLEALATGLMEEHYKAWPDMKLPALGNLTAREAMKSPRGREKVEALVASFELKQKKRPVQGLTTETLKNLRRDLGL